MVIFFYLLLYCIYILQEFGLDPLFIWTPVMEKDFGQPRFLTAHPITLIQNGEFHKVPFITGVTADEFAYKAFGEFLV